MIEPENWERLPRWRLEGIAAHLRSELRRVEDAIIGQAPAGAPAVDERTRPVTIVDGYALFGGGYVRPLTVDELRLYQARQLRTVRPFP